MKLLLISPYRDKGRKKKLLEKEIVHIAPVSILTVASLTPDGWDIEIVDEKVEDIDFNCDADLVGITAYTPEIQRACEIAEIFRKKEKKVVIGGSHASVMPQQVGKYCDSVVIGEAEGVWSSLLDDFQKGRLKKFYYGNLPDLNNSPPYNVKLLSKKYFLYPVQTQRGCPNSCEFCLVPLINGRKIRFRPLKSIEEEINQINSSFILFSDDNFLKNQKRVMEIIPVCKNSRKTFLIQTDIPSVSNLSVVKESIKAGIKVFFLGLESAVRDNLALIKKCFNLKYNIGELIDFIHDNGGFVVGSFIFGFDNDDESIFEKTVEFCFKNKIDVVLFTILTPLPGTPLFEKLKKEGRILTYDWRKYDCAHCVFIPKKLTPEKLEEGLNWAYRNFYTLSSLFKKFINFFKIPKVLLPINFGYFLVGRRGISKI